jgi:RimJ/RimL family protein N-acetyltransferase
VEINGQLYLRIAVGNRDFIYAKVLREPSNSKDKWITFMAMLLESWQTQNYFAYTVELKLREGEVYGSVSFEIPTPEVRYTKENGVIAIDTNAEDVNFWHPWIGLVSGREVVFLHQAQNKEVLQEVSLEC